MAKKKQAKKPRKVVSLIPRKKSGKKSVKKKLTMGGKRGFAKKKTVPKPPKKRKRAQRSWIKKPPRKGAKKPLLPEDKLRELFEKAQPRGFATYSEILYQFPGIERNIEALEFLYESLEDSGIRVEEVRE